MHVGNNEPISYRTNRNIGIATGAVRRTNISNCRRWVAARASRAPRDYLSLYCNQLKCSRFSTPLTFYSYIFTYRVYVRIILYMVINLYVKCKINIVWESRPEEVVVRIWILQLLNTEWRNFQTITELTLANEFFINYCKIKKTSLDFFWRKTSWIYLHTLKK